MSQRSGESVRLVPVGTEEPEQIGRQDASARIFITAGGHLYSCRAATRALAVVCLCAAAVGLTLNMRGSSVATELSARGRFVQGFSKNRDHHNSSLHGKIRHRKGYCLGVPDVKAGKHVHMWTCRTDFLRSEEAFRFHLGTGKIVNKHGLCMTEVDSSAHVWHCKDGLASQTWVQDGKHLINNATGHCLAKVGTHDSHIEMHTCIQGSDHQEWNITTASGDFGNILHGKIGCLHMPRPEHAGSPVHVQACFAHESMSRKTWTYHPTTGHIKIGSGLCLNAILPHKAGASVHVAPCHELAMSEGWKYYDSGQIVTRTGLCLSTKQERVNGGKVYLWHCNRHSSHQKWQLAQASGLSGAAPFPPQPAGELYEFYMYRAAAADTMGEYPFGNINTANIEGAVWYLLNEVVNRWKPEVQCPRKFGISKLYRFKVKVKTTKEMIDKGMTFGARYAWDRGHCSGRCFQKNLCSCWKDCVDMYAKYGHVPGCNLFSHGYPYPLHGDAPQAPDGIWYSLPLSGRCKHPTGAHDCTWSYEHAGVITIKELEERHKGWGNCCNGRCTYFWNDFWSRGKFNWRVRKVFKLFKEKYPHLPVDLGQSFCDFNHKKWYDPDPYHPRITGGWTCPS
mmetsp:Transcript_20089/g.50581  ORF Transcript_20089/g.50581 Transcript_20089/m.50581 type:complete len:621 (+) Transcript_20089:57-1919(+)